MPIPAPDILPYRVEDDMQDELLDAGARDKLNHQQDTFLANILTLGALPIAGGQMQF